MLKLINKTSYAANLYTGFDQNNEHQFTCVMKAGFAFDNDGKLESMSSDIEEVDRFSCEIMPFKYKNEILVYGAIEYLSIRWPDNKFWYKTARKNTTFGPIPSYFHYSMAPKDQQFDGSFQGGEIIAFGTTIALPNTKPKALLVADGKHQILNPVCDTVIINIEEKLLHMVWRTGILWPADHPKNGTVICQ